MNIPEIVILGGAFLLLSGLIGAAGWWSVPIIVGSIILWAANDAAL